MKSVIIMMVFFTSFQYLGAFDVLDPTGNITITWDVRNWIPDGYDAVVTIRNNQKYRHIDSPGWKLGWTWGSTEIVWGAWGAQAAEQGDCSKFRRKEIPHCCKRNPVIVDLLPSVPYNERFTNCCRGGVLSSTVQDESRAVSSFLISVGRAGTSTNKVILPKHFTLDSPGPGYTCGSANITEPTKFYTIDGRRSIQAIMTWKVICSYSPFRASRTPRCCVSISAFYSRELVTCPECSCGCPSTSCAKLVSPKPVGEPVCTSHMCPVRIHWHVKENYKDYWRVKITITSFNRDHNYSEWNIVAQHFNFNNLSKSFSFNYQPLYISQAINDTAMFWGMKDFNDILQELGYVQSEILFGKNKSIFSFENGWAFPERIYFNGDNCVMPSPQDYPPLPRSTSRSSIVMLMVLLVLGVGSLTILVLCLKNKMRGYYRLHNV